VLGKRLGAAVKEVSTAIRALSSEQVLAMQAAGYVEVAGQRLDVSDIKVRPVPGLAGLPYSFSMVCSIAYGVLVSKSGLLVNLRTLP
jgi:hypothetical protein